MVVDADCLLSSGALEKAASACHASGRPVQMLDLMQAPRQGPLKLRIMEFAMVMKNLIRPLGTMRLTDSCHLMGTGMALPWNALSNAALATGHVAEDMQLGIELARAGCVPQLLLDAQVSSRFVQDLGVARIQKSRWEHGHLALLRQQLGPLLIQAITQRNRALAGLALDLMIPPLALYTLVLGGVLAVALLASIVGVPAGPATAVLAMGNVCLALAVWMAWWKHGRAMISCRELLSLPLYAAWKLPVYLAYLIGDRSSWVRTRRTGEWRGGAR